MNTDLRDKIAAALYFAHEVTGQGDAMWDELIANHGDHYETVVAYRAMADYVMPVVGAEIAGWAATSEADTQTAAAMATRALNAEGEREAALELLRWVGSLADEWFVRGLTTAAKELNTRLGVGRFKEPGCDCNGMASCEQCQERDVADHDRNVKWLRGQI